MSEYFYLEDGDTPIALGFDPMPLRDAPMAEEPPAAPVPGGDEALDAIGRPDNARQIRDLPAMTWEVGHFAAMEWDGISAGILASRDRVLVHSSGAWTLFDAGTKQIAKESFAPSSLTFDSRHGLFYGSHWTGYLAAWRLADGKLAHKLDFIFGSAQYRKALIHRQDAKILVTSIERMTDAHGVKFPKFGLMEVREAEAPLDAKPSDQVTRSRQIAKLYRNSAILFTAVHGESLVIVCNGIIYVSDLGLKIRAAFQGEFTPESMSMGPAGRIHIVVMAEQKRALWILDLAGRRMLDLPFPPEWERPIEAPIIGYDHRIFLQFEKRVVALSPLGKKLWEKEYLAGVAGISVTPDGHVLISAGEELLGLEPDGKRNVLVRLRGESLRTRALITAGGIVVAGGKGLYRLTPRKQEE